MTRGRDLSRNAGFTLIEVLITLLIIAIGLLGLAGLQVTTLQNQFEAYQRAQAVMLAEEMASRIRSNAPAARATPGAYTPTVPVTYGVSDDNCNPSTQTTAEYDLCSWNNLLRGQDVQIGTDSVGGINRALGCIEDLAVTGTTASNDGEKRIRVSVAWLGTKATKAPKTLLTCGLDAYGDDAFRRVAFVDVVLADLQ